MSHRARTLGNIGPGNPPSQNTNAPEITPAIINQTPYNRSQRTASHANVNTSAVRIKYMNLVPQQPRNTAIGGNTSATRQQPPRTPQQNLIENVRCEMNRAVERAQQTIIRNERIEQLRNERIEQWRNDVATHTALETQPPHPPVSSQQLGPPPLQPP
jgi:hypothetical protein